MAAAARDARSWAALVLATVLTGGCATSHNYLDPDWPKYAEVLAPPRAMSSPGGSLRVVTYNIEFGRRVTEALAALETYPPLRSPDVLCLEEMDFPGTQRIARALGLNYVYYPASREGCPGRGFGNAVLSPWPIEASWKVPLPHRSRLIHRARAAVAARIRVGAETLVVYSVHLGSPLAISGGQRRDQVEAILADLEAREGPTIVAGDFNSKGIGKVFVAAGFAWPTRDIGGTRGHFSFDHVFARGLVAAAAPSAGVIREATEASDHRPVWATLILRDGPAGP